MGAFILIVIFAHGTGPYSSFTTLGEYTSLRACQESAKLVLQGHAKQDLIGAVKPQLICAAKEIK